MKVAQNDREFDSGLFGWFRIGHFASLRCSILPLSLYLSALFAGPFYRRELRHPPFVTSRPTFDSWRSPANDVWRALRLWGSFVERMCLCHRCSPCREAGFLITGSVVVSHP